jgi:hypothetical protein
MWQRIAVGRPIVYEPAARAGWRVHGGAETSRLLVTGRNMREVERCIDASAGRLPADRAADVQRRARIAYTRFAVDNAFKLLRRTGNVAATLRQLAAARRLGSSAEILRYVGRRLTGREEAGS